MTWILFSDIFVTFLLTTTAYIGRTPGICKVIFCLDNDKAGNEAYSMFYNKYMMRGLKVYSNFSGRKDWNEELLSRISDNSQMEALSCNR